MPGAPLAADDPQSMHGYRLLRRLGAGGMGVVYLGVDDAGGQVAAKVMRREFADDPSFRARFAREAAAVRAVQGPRTVRVLAAGVEAEQPYLITEYVAGESLAERIANSGPLPAEEGVRLAEALAEALVAIHSAGIVHRDLKPSNVIMAAGGPKVIDFGIAQVADGTALTRTGIVVGTPGFLAPEQIDRRSVQGPAIDVYAWGLTVAYALTGRPPFGTGPAEVVLYRVLHDTPDLDGVPAGIAPVLHSALRRDPDTRPTAGELAGLLADPHLAETVAAATQLAPAVPSTPPPSPPRPRRRWALAALVTAVSVILVGSLLAATALLNRPGDPPSGDRAADDRPGDDRAGDEPGAAEQGVTDPGPGVEQPASATPTAAGALTATQIVHITPWDELSGEPAGSVVITGEATGDCWSRSVFLNRRDAWRCSTEDGQIQDPCFGSGPRPVLLCSTDRGKPEMMLRLELLGPLPELEHLPPEPGSDSDYIGALMLVLADGQRCLFMSGATGAAADQRTSFQCPEGRLYGDPDTRNPVWTISYRAEGAADLVPVEIAAVYQ